MPWPRLLLDNRLFAETIHQKGRKTGIVIWRVVDGKVIEDHTVSGEATLPQKLYALLTSSETRHIINSKPTVQELKGNN